MQPQVRYVKSADGTRLAVSTLGEGQPLVILPGPFGISIDGLWEIPAVRSNLERLAEKRKVVQYDCRGVGLSSRDVEDFSLSALEQDLLAFIVGLDLAAVDVLSFSRSGPTAMSFAAHYPERMRKLVLLSSASRVVAYEFPGADWRAAESLLGKSWTLYRQATALVLYGWTETGRIWAERSMSDTSAETHVRMREEMDGWDATELLSLLRCPTLVMHNREQASRLDSSRELAASIPNARLLTFTRSGGAMLGADWEAAFAPIVAFLDEGSVPTEIPASRAPVEDAHDTALILFVDIADSTPLTEQMGDAAFRAKARALDTALRAIIRDNSGTAIEGKVLGDGVLAVFTSARQAIVAARACGEFGDREGLPLHLGIHAGDVMREDKNVYGGSVNIAARIAAASAPGELLVSDTVRSLARTSAGVKFEDRGEQTLKGVSDPVRLFAVT